MIRDEDDRPDETDVVAALIGAINDHADELQRELGARVAARTFSEALLLSHHEGFEVKIGEQTFHLTCMEKSESKR